MCKDSHFAAWISVPAGRVRWVSALGFVAPLFRCPLAPTLFLAIFFGRGVALNRQITELEQQGCSFERAVP
jgi:hypothetical protein